MGTIIADNCVYGSSMPCKYKPIEIPLWKVKLLMKRDTFRDSLLVEELRFNLAHNKYSDKYSKKLRKLMVKYLKEIKE